MLRLFDYVYELLISYGLVLLSMLLNFLDNSTEFNFALWFSLSPAILQLLELIDAIMLELHILMWPSPPWTTTVIKNISMASSENCCRELQSGVIMAMTLVLMTKANINDTKKCYNLSAC